MGALSDTVIANPPNQQYAVGIWATKRPLKINSPDLPKAQRGPAALVSWSVEKWYGMSPTTAQAAPYIPAWIQPTSPGRPIVIAHGIRGTLYSKGTNGQLVELVSFIVWTQKHWTWEAVASSIPQERIAAVDLSHAIATTNLPTRIGLGMVQTIHEEKITFLLWVKNRVLVTLSGEAPSTHNILDTFKMAQS